MRGATVVDTTDRAGSVADVAEDCVVPSGVDDTVLLDEDDVCNQ